MEYPSWCEHGAHWYGTYGTRRCHCAVSSTPSRRMLNRAGGTRGENQFRSTGSRIDHLHLANPSIHGGVLVPIDRRKLQHARLAMQRRHCRTVPGSEQYHYVAPVIGFSCCGPSLQAQSINRSIAAANHPARKTRHTYLQPLTRSSARPRQVPYRGLGNVTCTMALNNAVASVARRNEFSNMVTSFSTGA